MYTRTSYGFVTLHFNGTSSSTNWLFFSASCLHRCIETQGAFVLICSVFICVFFSLRTICHTLNSGCILVHLFPSVHIISLVSSFSPLWTLILTLMLMQLFVHKKTSHPFNRKLYSFSVCGSECLMCEAATECDIIQSFNCYSSSLFTPSFCILSSHSHMPVCVLSNRCVLTLTFILRSLSFLGLFPSVR